MAFMRPKLSDSDLLYHYTTLLTNVMLEHHIILLIETFINFGGTPTDLLTGLFSNSQHVQVKALALLERIEEGKLSQRFMAELNYFMLFLIQSLRNKIAMSQEEK